MFRPIRLIRRGLAYPIVYLAMFWAWLLIAIWGAIYLFQLFVYLQAPGIPAEYTYQTEQGDVVVRVSSYAIDPWRLAIRAWDAQVTDQIGDSQYSANFITVSYQIGAVHVTANRVEGRIERLEDGSFNFDRLIPDPDEDAEPIPLRVEIAEGDLTYIDLAGPTRIERSVVIHNAVLEQSGDTIVAAEASVDASPFVPLVVFVGEDGEIWIESRFDGVDLAAFWPVIKAWVDEETLGTWYAADATRAIATGWVRVSVTEEDVLMRGSANVNAFGVYLPDLTRSAAIVGTVSLEGSRVRTQFRMADGASTVTFNGGAVLGESLAVAGNLFHSSSRPGDLPPLVREFLPAGLDYRSASYDGYVEYGSDQWLADGAVTFSSLNLDGNEFEGIAGSVSSTEDRLVMDVDRAVYLEIPVAGALQIDFAADSVEGFFDSESIALRPLLQEYGFDAFGGQTTLAVVVGGTTSSITADAFAEGDLILYYEEFDEPLALGPFQASAQLLDGVLTIQRFGLEGAYGSVTAEGTIDLVNEQIQLQIGGGGIQIEAFDNETSGTVFFEADVAGTFDDPVVLARVEGYALEYADFLIPQFVSNVVYSGDEVIAEQFQARIGFGFVEGSATYNLDSGAIGGVFSSSPIVVSTLADVDIIGRVRVVDGVIAGTLADPELTANLLGNNLLVFGVPVTDLSSGIYLDQGGAEFFDAQFSVEDGSALAAGRYDFSTATLNVAGSLDGVPLSVIPFQSEQFLLSGGVTGEFTARIGDVIDNSGTANLQVSNFEVNSTPIGSGSLEVGMDGPIMTASGSIGSIDRYVLLERAEHNIDTNEVDASVVVFNFPAENLVQIFDDEIRDLPGNVQAPILRTTGSISAAATIEGELENPNVQMNSLIASDMEIGGRPAGEVRATASRSDGLWIVDNLDWRVDDTVLMLSGTAIEGGEFETFGSLSSFDLSWINVFYPEMAPVTGKANFSAMVGGTSENIFGRASLDVGEIAYVGYDGTISEVPIRVSIPTMVLADDVVTADGLVFFQGLPGVLTARVPLSALEENGSDPLEARVVLEDRDLSTLESYFNGIDYEKSEGSLGGFISLVGTPANFEFDGEAYLRASQLVMDGLQTEFSDVDVRLDIAPEDAVLNMSAISSEGGEVSGQLIANYINPLERGFSVQQFRDQTTLSGRVEFNEFAVSERVGDAQDQSVGTIDGEVIVTGLAVTPVIDADIVATDVSVTLPSEFAVGTEATALAIEPTFRNVVLRTGSPASIVTAIGNVLVEGSGQVTGTIGDPIVRAPMNVVGGTFRLPTARIDLQEGGTINVDYDASAGFEEPARIDVDITGLTRVTARTIADVYESYEVSLNFRGNLMQDEGLRITAVSDPPGLSQDRILAIIGQQDLIEALSQSVVGGRTGDSFREAVYSFAFPSLLGGFAEQLATSLNLDYVTIDYNPFDQAVLAAGLTLSEGLMLQIRRQLSEPSVGPLRYEIKLSYRLPLSDPNLSRIRFGIATDERVPWKITIDWGRRF